MPDDNSRQVNKSNAEVANRSPDNVEEAIWHMKIHDNQEQGGVARPGPYPDRPGEPDCMYYMRNGVCAYGSNCRFNHPPNAAQGTLFREDLPQRVGQPDCGYYLKTGTCKYGPTCKYHHPKDRNGAGPVLFNILGLPMRQDEKSCSHYMRYGSCKFGVACKFHHPQPVSPRTGLPVNGATTAFGPTGSSNMLSGMPYVGGVPTWSISRAPYISDPRVQGSQAYVPVIIPPSQGMIPASGWNTYMGSLGPMSSAGILTSSALYNSKSQGKSGSGAHPSLSSTANASLPERPDQPECRYFINNGMCKYGSECKYHHPKERMPQLVTSMVGPQGLPSRPGQVVCPNYATYGLCKFGPTCRFDHPFVGYSYGYSLSVPPYPAFDSSLTSYSRISQNGVPSETPLPPSSKYPGWVQKSDDTTSKCRNLEINTKTSVDSPEPASSPSPPPPPLLPHSAQASSEPSHD